MNDKLYIKMLNIINSNRVAFTILGVMYKWLPLLVFLCYPVMLTLKGLQGFDKSFWLLLCVPAGVLVLVTVLRKLFKRQRPYEIFSTPPLFEREGKGDSFPSRHTASAFIIAMGGFLLSIWLGTVLLITAAMIGAARVLAGVHYISDVLAGAVLAVAAGSLFFII